MNDCVEYLVRMVWKEIERDLITVHWMDFGFVVVRSVYTGDGMTVLS